MKNGDIICFPTDTVYGLAAKYYDSVGIEKIYQLKERERGKKFAVLVSSVEEAKSLGKIDEKIEKLMKSFWPGALTIIVPTNPNNLNAIQEYPNTIGLRMPNSPIALELIKKYGPLATTSVNHSGEKPLNSYEEIYEKYKDRIDEYYPASMISSDVSSTVISFVSDELQILRQGTITKDEILKSLEK